MRSEKIQLVALSGTQKGKIYASDWSPPLGLLALATHLRKECFFKNKKLKIEILDEQIHDKKRLCNYDTDIRGYYATLLNYSKIVEDIDKFKKNNPKGIVILGGPHSTLSGNILRNQLDVDVVVNTFTAYGTLDGEEVLTAYILGEDKEKIPNLVWRKGEKIVKNKVGPLNPYIDYYSITPPLERQYPLVDPYHIPDRDFVDMEKYFENYRKRFPSEPFKRPTTMYSQKGCWFGKCPFCINVPFQRSHSVYKFWREVKNLKENFDIDLIFVVDENPKKERFLGLAYSKPSDLNVALKFYASPSQLDKETIKALEKLNCYELLIGKETADPALEKKLGKGRLEFKTVEFMLEQGIRPRISFCLGLENENEKSLENTLMYAKKLKEIGLESATCSIFLPMCFDRECKGKAFEKMMQHKNLEKRYLFKDAFNIDELQKDWFKYFCNISLEKAKQYQNEINTLFKIHGHFA